jgi:hypothetical protein
MCFRYREKLLQGKIITNGVGFEHFVGPVGSVERKLRTSLQTVVSEGKCRRNEMDHQNSVKGFEAKHKTRNSA